MCSSFLSEGEVFGECVELGWFLKQDGNLRVNFSSSLSLQVLLLDAWHCGVPVFGQDLWQLADKWNGFSQTLDLDISMLFEHELGKEEAFIEPAGSANSINVVFVELGLLGHVVN